MSTDINIKIGGKNGNTVVRNRIGDLVGGCAIYDNSDNSVVAVLDADLPELIKALQEVQAHIEKLSNTEGDEQWK